MTKEDGEELGALILAGAFESYDHYRGKSGEDLLYLSVASGGSSN